MNTYRRTINGAVFSASAEEVLYPQVEELFRALEGVPAETVRDGARIEIGFTLFSLAAGEGGYAVLAPDYAGSPFSDSPTDDMTLALWVQGEQVGLLRGLGLPGEPVRFDDSIAVAEGALEGRLVGLQRFPDLGGSGWCARAIEKAEDGAFLNVEASGYASLYAYQLLRERPALLKALALPYGYIAVFDGDEVAEILDDKDQGLLHG